jgi:hypothetical protein
MKEAAKPDLTQQLAGNVAPGNGSKSQSSPMSSGEETTQAIEDQLPY